MQPKTIEMNNKVFFIDKENGGVEATYKKNAPMNKSTLADLAHTNFIKLLNRVVSIASRNDYCLRGVAATCEGDEFSEKTGIDLAGSKLDLKYHERRFKDYEEMYWLLSGLCDMAEVKALLHSIKAINIAESIDKRYYDGSEEFLKDHQDVYDFYTYAIENTMFVDDTKEGTKDESI